MFLRRSFCAAVILGGTWLTGATSASAQFYNPFARGSSPTYSSSPGQRFIPLDDEDDDAAPRRTQRSRAESIPRPAVPLNRRANPVIGGDDLYDDVLPRSTARPRAGSRVASLPPDADRDYSSLENYDGDVDTSQTTRRVVSDPTGQADGTLTINTRVRKLYLSLGDGRAVEYGIGVGRQGFEWKGTAKIGRKAVWPGWTPPKEMLLRRPDLPKHMEGGMENPLGARALYLFKGNKDTLFRIHGTNEPETIGRAVSSGCIRMHNADVMDLYQRVSKGASVVVI
jgi:lipoprotein-anchoring transpeptidase ErfK/SrfK